MRAFLSHSSKDKGFVEQVAQNLRPGSYELDALTFEKGGLNAKEIIAALSRSDLFCLFLSKDSIDSNYVDYEGTFAQELVASGDIKRVLTICLDEESFDKYNGFMKHYNMVRKQIDPASTARLIEGILLSSHKERDEKLHPFIGREAELKVLEDQAVDMNKPFVKGLFVAGNAGSGRRTISKKFFQNHYPNVRRIFPQIHIEDFVGYDDIFRKIIMTLRPSISIRELRDVVSEFADMDDENKAKSIADEINDIAMNGEALIIHDSGGLLTGDGSLDTEFNAIVNFLTDRPHPPVILISSRMTSKNLRRKEDDLVYASIGPLSFENSKRLLSRLLKEDGVSTNPENLDRLTQLADQHPFNIYRIRSLVLDQSVDVFLGNPVDFIEWKHKQTSDYLRNATLTNLDAKILAIFSIAPELDFHTLCEVVDYPSNDVSLSIQKMIELHVVRVEEDRISISPALRVATERDARIELKNSERSKVMISLAHSLSVRLQDEDGPITLIDAAIMATLEGEAPVSKLMEPFILPSHRVWLAKTHYDKKRWNDAIKMAGEAINSASGLSKSGEIAACRYLAQSAARINDQETFQRALSRLRGVSRDGWVRSIVNFLEGLNLRLSGDFHGAYKFFLTSYELANGSRATARELASVCLKLGKHGEAEKYARKAHGYAKRSPFIIDILISCLVHSKKRDSLHDPEVLGLLDTLEILDQEEGRSFYTTRKAEIQYLYGNNRVALKLIKEALHITPGLFEPLHLYAKMLLKDGNPSRALEAIGTLQKIVNKDRGAGMGPNSRQYHLLKAEYFIEIGEYKEAMKLLGNRRNFSDEDRADLQKTIDIAKAYKVK